MPCPASSETIQTNNGSKQRFANKQTNNQAMADESTTRKITLHEFKPESYKVWEMSTKATLKYNKLLNIVDGTETNPTPRNDDGRVLRPFSARDGLRARTTRERSVSRSGFRVIGPISSRAS